MRLLIVDDEPLIRSGIRRDVETIPQVEVAGECGSVAEAVQVLRGSQIDLLLLDVQLPDGTGFDVVREIGPSAMPPVIFVTAYDQYAIQAFECSAVDYLLKPFDDVRLRASIEKVGEPSVPTFHPHSSTRNPAEQSKFGVVAAACSAKSGTHRPGASGFDRLD